MKITQQGVRLKVMWYGNLEGTELFDLDHADRKQLIDSGRAEEITREIEAPAQQIEPVAENIAAEIPTQNGEETERGDRALNANEIAGLSKRKVFGK